MKSSVNICGRASKWMRITPTASIVSGTAMKMFAPARPTLRKSTATRDIKRVAESQIMPFSPNQECNRAKIMSLSHSQANQGCPALENEKKS